jgi:CheY-like chemotaxis protein
MRDTAMKDNRSDVYGGPVAGNYLFPALVVDDDVLVAEVLSHTLEDLGFRVINAPTVTAALQVCRTQERFLFACIDLGLPDRSGLELIAELRQLQPDLPIIVATGFADLVQRDDMQPHALLTKPYDAKSIAVALREVGIQAPSTASGSDD